MKKDPMGSCLPCRKRVRVFLLAREEGLGPSRLVVFQGRQGACACLGAVDGMGSWFSGAWVGTR